MDFLNFFNSENAEYIEELYEKYQREPSEVDEAWRCFFAGFEVGLGRPLRGAGGVQGEFAALSQRRSDGTGDLVHSYRELGHFVAKLDPLGNHRSHHPLLDLTEFGYSSSADLDRKVGNGGFMGETDGTLRSLVDRLQETYCGTLGVEFLDIPNKDQRAWLMDHIEPNCNRPNLTPEQKRRILTLLISAQDFEQFLHTKFVGQKRFSVEGGESLIPLLDTLIEEGAKLGVEEVVLGMAHRGRLNVLAHTMGKPYELTCAEFEGEIPQEGQGDGDVKYHKGYSNDRVTIDGAKVHLSLSPNPSHLELVDPIVEGVVRAKQHRMGDTGQTRVVPILIHGEAAFAGQGIVPETLNLSELDFYRTGGTIHVIINNQLGFTATENQTRFTPYATDVAKTIQAPIFHINADDPEAVVHAARLAIGFREQFKVDVMLDMWCYRRYGHNETDDPTFTQPIMYSKIAGKKPVAEIYAQKLISEGVVTAEDVEKIRTELKAKMEDSLTIAREKHPREDAFTFGGLWKGMARASDNWEAKTAVSAEAIQRVAEATCRVPDGFHIHRKLQRLVEGRREMAEGKKRVDWGCAESWALGTLLLEGTPIRLTGQDCERGTFSHRHAVWHDTENGEIYVPLAHMAEGQADLIIVNTMLSELAVVGFEYGYSMADPKNLVVWEAQFGDFANGAQPIFDQFISSSESKWHKMSGIVLLLPHGYEGQGPEHSSARLERYLQGCAENNIQVCYPTTPAQYFHVLRRQMHRGFRKPLILMTPKSLLRDDRATSTLEDFTERGFHNVIEDATTDPKKVERLIFCTGKVYYTLESGRAELGLNESVSLVRVEQMYPFPQTELQKVLTAHSSAKKILWVQEEAKNMGAWTFMESRLGHLLPEGLKLEYVGRKEASSPATGSFRRHQKEEAEIVKQALVDEGHEKH